MSNVAYPLFVDNHYADVLVILLFLCIDLLLIIHWLVYFWTLKCILSFGLIKLRILAYVSVLFISNDIC